MSRIGWGRGQNSEDILAAIDATIKDFNVGDIVKGRIVKVGRDEVLLDIGYKTEGVISSSELSVKHDVDPREIVKVGDEVEALVLQKEDKEGRLILSKKRAQPPRAGTTKELRRQLADNEAELEELRQRLADRDAQLLEARRTVAEGSKRESEMLEQLRTSAERAAREGELLDKLQTAAERAMRERNEARTIARGLWAAMPSQGRLSYFESGSSWLPEWIAGKDE